MITTLTADQLYHACNLDTLTFNNTTELEPLLAPLGQERALEAIEFGVEIERDGFNLFVLGAPGLGKHRVVEQILAKRGQLRAPLYDWCYVNNFDDPQKPRLLKLPAGKGRDLCRAMQQLVEDLLTAIPAAFQSDDYQRRRQEIASESSKYFEEKFHALDEEARQHNIAVMRTPTGYTMAPMIDDKVITPEEFEALDKEHQDDAEKTIIGIQKKLQAIIREMPLIRRDVSHRIKDLNQEITRLTVEQFIAGTEKQYADFADVLHYLQAVKKSAIERADDFLPEGDATEIEQVERKAREFHLYQVNVLVDNTDRGHTPIVIEDIPTYQNLVGRVEHIAKMGTLLTDFTLIKPGALHRANGGYLILNLQKVLSNLYAWEGLKRSLKARQVTITSLQDALSLGGTVSLEPEPMPVDVKVILTGEASLYYLLKYYDHEFDELFKVVADFAYRTDRSDSSHRLYARMIAAQQQAENVRPLNRAAVARLIEAASRHAEDSSKLSLHVDYISDLLKEADYWAQKSGSDTITLDHIEQTLSKRHYRLDRIREQYHEQITRGISLIEVSGTAVAQVNGLTVISVGGHAFGSPSRITATARLGSGRVIDIEREAKLGGEIHSKGVMILSSYLANTYARDNPLPLSASLVFEQSYGGIDGDSATAAELCALLSAIAAIPLKQNIAVTGSMNQHGIIQAIGGVNEKIEGFFDVCSARGLRGDQGVVIPASNQVHLMLRKDIGEAVAKGDFHIYTATTVGDVIEILSGLPLGVADSDGVFNGDSVNGRITARIAEWQRLHKKFSNSDNADDNNNIGNSEAGEERSDD